MEQKRDSVFRSLDWVMISIYLILVVCGWFSICGASYDFSNPDFFDLATRSGKQFMWIGFSLALSFVIVMLDDKMYETFSYLVYIGLVLLLIVTIFIAPDTKGSRSWLILGPISLQPAEFAKFATALAMSKFISDKGFSVNNIRNILITLTIIVLPMLLIIAQKETGSALVYLSFFLVLYREGMSGSILFVGLCMVLYFIFGVRYNEVYLNDSTTSLGSYIVIAMINFFIPILMRIYTKDKRQANYIFLLSLVVLSVSYISTIYLPYLHAEYILLPYTFFLSLFLFYKSLKTGLRNYSLIGVFSLLSVLFLFSSDYVFEKVLEPHQRTRVKIVLGLEEDLAGAGYNVNQSKIAIGSGGVWGKGFLNGTQTKLKYVPEQDTDFIFCTVGEEQGFVGTCFVLLLFLFFILRLVYLSERQATTFGRIYGYSVLSIFLFHLFINIGMVVGLTPVIGIPLPFFSYGGSSLWGFTILLFIFLCIDARNKRIG